MKQGRLEGYLFQTVLWERKIGQDIHARPLFALEVKICARKQQCVKLVRDAKGSEAVSRAVVYCVEDVKTGDRLDGAEVIAVSEYVDEDGSIVGTRAHL